MSLEIELSKQIAKNLGTAPLSIGKVGLSHPILLVKEQLKLSLTEDGNSVDRYAPLWYGEAPGFEGMICCLLSALNGIDPDNLEIAIIIAFKNNEGRFEDNSIQIGFQYDYTDDCFPGVFCIKAENKWIPMSTAQKIQLALGFELMAQDGCLWNGGGYPQEMKKSMAEFLALDFS